MSEEENKQAGNTAAAEKVENLKDSDIKWRAKYKSTKAELEELKVQLEKDKRDLSEKIALTERSQKSAHERVIQAELKAEAVAAGLNDLDLLKLIDTSSVKMDEKGQVVGLKEAISEFKTKKPAYFGSERKTSSSAGAETQGNTEVSQFNAKTASREEYEKEKARLLGRR